MLRDLIRRARVALIALTLLATATCERPAPEREGFFNSAQFNDTPFQPSSSDGVGGFLPSSNGGGFTAVGDRPFVTGIGIFGQSNAALRGNSTLVGYGVGASTIYASATITTSSSFTPPQAYARQSLQPIAPTGLNSGLELALGRAIVQSGTGAAGLPIVKMGIDGTDIDTWILDANYSRWVTDLRGEATATNRTISDLVWVQGEADAGDATKSANYEARLTTFAAKVHASFPTARMWVIRLNANCTAAPITTAWRDAVRLAETNVVAANSTWMYLVDVDDIELGVDNAHYTANGYWALGTRVADRIRSVVGNNLPTDSTTAPFVRAINNASMSNNTVGLGVVAHPPPSKVGDTQVLIISSGNLNVTPTLTTANGFTQITNSPQFSLSGGNYGWLSVYTRVWNGTDADPVVNGGTTQQRRQAFILAIGNTSGLAQNATASVNNAFSTSATIASITTPSNNNLVLRIHASYATADNNVSSVSGCTLLRDEYGPVKQMAQVFSDVKTTAGATGACTFTHATTSLQANLVLAFAP